MTPTPKLIIACRIEELPALGGFLISSLNGDLVSFTAFSSTYNATYVTNANASLGSVTALLQPKTLMAELKVITLRMVNNIFALEQPLNFLEGYIKRATGLTVAAKDFGISNIRKGMYKGDVERIVFCMNYTLNLVNNTTNKPLLLAKGYTLAQDTFLKATRDALSDDNIAQNTKVNDINNLVTANYGVLNDFWKNYISDISDAGKRIFKKTYKEDDYTIAALKRRIRQEQLKNKFVGTVIALGHPIINRLKISMKPVVAGRRRSVKAKADGSFEIKSLVATDWIVTISAPGFQTITDAVTIVTGQTVTKNYQLQLVVNPN